MARRLDGPLEAYEDGSSFSPMIHVGRDVLPIAIQHGMDLW